MKTKPKNNSLTQEQWLNLNRSYRFYKRGTSHREAIGAIAHWDNFAASIVRKIKERQRENHRPLARLEAATNYIKAHEFYRLTYRTYGIYI
jgi:hypothetical protein